MRFPKLFFIYLPIAFTINMFVLITTSMGTTLSYEGFAVDRAGNLYLGMDGRIGVRDPQGDIIREFSPGTSRGYRFTIENDTVWVDMGDYICTFDLEGNPIEKTESDSIPRSERPDCSSRRFTADDGTVYLMRSPLLRTCVYRLEEGKRIGIYRMPVFDYTVKCLEAINYIAAFIIIPYIIIYLWKRDPANATGRPYNEMEKALIKWGDWVTERVGRIRKIFVKKQ